jgi:hypothetical protein
MGHGKIRGFGVRFQESKMFSNASRNMDELGFGFSNHRQLNAPNRMNYIERDGTFTP